MVSIAVNSISLCHCKGMAIKFDNVRNSQFSIFLRSSNQLPPQASDDTNASQIGTELLVCFVSTKYSSNQIIKTNPQVAKKNRIVQKLIKGVSVFLLDQSTRPQILISI